MPKTTSPQRCSKNGRHLELPPRSELSQEPAMEIEVTEGEPDQRIISLDDWPSAALRAPNCRC
jgi:hypothetical protein